MLGSSAHDDGIEDETTASGMLASPANKVKGTASNSNASSLNGSVATVSAAAQQKIEEEIIAEEIRLAQ